MQTAAVLFFTRIVAVCPAVELPADAHIQSSTEAYLRERVEMFRLAHCPLAARPIVIHRSASSLCSASNTVTDSGSRKTVAATTKDTPCFPKFPSAFFRVPFDFNAESAHHSTINSTHEDGVVSGTAAIQPRRAGRFKTV